VNDGARWLVNLTVDRIALKDIRSEHFHGQEGRVFVFEPEQSGTGEANRQWHLELIETSPMRRRRRLEDAEGKEPERVSRWRDPFSLLFRNLDPEPLDDVQLHHLLDVRFEPCSLLLTRVLVPYLEPGEMYYEAVFS
jgi:hypothetical protein